MRSILFCLMSGILTARAATSLPAVDGARIERGLAVGSTTLVHYISSDVAATDATHALVVVHGVGRDAWNAFAAGQAGVRAAAGDGLVDATKVVIDAPVFFNGNDKGEFPVDANGNPTSNELVWKGNGWSEGEANQFPTSDTNVSSFAAMDALLAHFADKKQFPKVQSITLAGHSAGGQFVQRYALVGGDAPSGIKDFRYVVANPGSYAYLNDVRPRPNATCTTFNNWKFGLAKYPNSYGATAVKSKSALTTRYLALPLAYLYGAAPDAPGTTLDVGCEAETQGTTHKARTRNFYDVLHAQFPVDETRQYVAGVPGVAHDAPGVFSSTVGREALFGTEAQLTNARDAELYSKVTTAGYTVTLEFKFKAAPAAGYQVTFDLRTGQTIGAVRGATVFSTDGEQVVLRGDDGTGVTRTVSFDVAGASADVGKVNGFQIVAR